MRNLLGSFLLIISISIQADDHSCPDDRPHPGAGTTCDSCPWEETVERYKTGEFSTLRSSKIFGHSIRVSVVCDTNRPIDVDEVFSKIDETEQTFKDVLGSSVRHEYGNGAVLEVITGICDYGGGIDDCVMYEVCREGGVGAGAQCSVSSGYAVANSGGIATHAAFVPFLPEGESTWIEGNRYVNLQHEFTHLLDYTYFRIDSQRGTDLDWWVEGLPQFIQWRILGDSLSWNRGNNEARLLEIFTHRWNTRDYYDGMRVFAFLEKNAPYLIDEMAQDVRRGIYRNASSHLAWFSLLGYVASRHETAYREFVYTGGRAYNRADETAVEGIEDMIYRPN